MRRATKIDRDAARKQLSSLAPAQLSNYVGRISAGFHSQESSTFLARAAARDVHRARVSVHSLAPDAGAAAAPAVLADTPDAAAAAAAASLVLLLTSSSSVLVHAATSNTAIINAAHA
ncbi:hypothetical protein [Burkholderia mayonis]|uniref:hypothetical protein n=1 Tax=Burkholderia mayonis TaxID=1385591 RepID=UPI000AE1B9E3|nr:hypothetical protein [Burkholderia mayonis]